MKENPGGKVVTNLLRFLIIVMAMSLCTCNQQQSPQYSQWVSYNYTDKTWAVRGRGMPLYLLPNTGGGFYFDFPIYTENPVSCLAEPSCPVVGYVTREGLALTGQNLTMELTITTSPNVAFNYALESSNNCNVPANVRLFFQRRNDNFQSEFYRWWSNPTSVKLAPGFAKITVPLTPNKWSSVYGKFGNSSPEALEGFNQAKAQAQNVGMTFGGGCSFGHGVNISSGSARFLLTKYSVE